MVDEKSVEVEEGRLVAWCAGGIGVECQHKGKRAVLLHWFLFLIPIIFPTMCPLVFLLSVFVNVALALALAGKMKRSGEEWRDVVGRGREDEVEAMTT